MDLNGLKRYWLGIFSALLLLLAAAAIYQKLHPKRLPPDLIAGAGRIDGDLIRLGVKYPGRVETVTVDDGDSVRRGETVARLRSDELREKLAGIRDQAAAKSKELQAKKTELSIARKTIPLALTRAQAQLEARNAALQGLSNEVAALERVVEQDQRDFNRVQNLYLKALLPKERFEQADLKLRTDRDKLASLQEKLKAARTAVTVARADLSQAQAEQSKIKALQQGIEALQEGVRAAYAAEKEVAAMLQEMTLRSPVDGLVIEKIAEPGEVLAAGMPVATLVDPASLYLKIFVDTLQNGRIKIGDKAEIFLDGAPNRPIPARVIRVAQKAEFTPKEVSVRSDRIQRVFAVHLRPLRKVPELKLGLPAVGVVSTDGKHLPASLHELPEI